MRLLIFIFCLSFLSIASLVGHAQRVVWERRLSWVDDDILYDVIGLDDGTYMASGIRGSYLSPDGNYNPSVTLVRIDEFGDTLFVANSGLFGGRPMMCRMRSGDIYLFTQSQLLAEPDVLLLGKISPNGQLLAEKRIHAFPGGTIGTNRLVEGPSGSLIAVGTGPDTGSAFGNRMYVTRFDTSGVVYWSKVINDNNFYTFGNWIEETARHTYLASGTAGSRIWAIELDSNGVELRRGTFYTTPSRYIFDETACVKQAPGGNYVVSGTIQSSPGRFYLGLHAGWGTSRIWGGERQGFNLAPHISDDGSIVYISGYYPNINFSKIDADSQAVWQVDFGNRLGQSSPAPAAFSYNTDSSVIAVGRAGFPAPARSDFYLARITGVGVPYNPAQPVATKPKANQPGIRPYPNPCTTTLRFAGLTQLARLEVYGVEGRRHLQAVLQPRQTVDVSSLPRGLYLYRLSSQGKAWSGRVVKE